MAKKVNPTPAANLSAFPEATQAEEQPDRRRGGDQIRGSGEAV